MPAVTIYLLFKLFKLFSLFDIFNICNIFNIFNIFNNARFIALCVHILFGKIESARCSPMFHFPILLNATPSLML